MNLTQIHSNNINYPSGSIIQSLLFRDGVRRSVNASNESILFSGSFTKKRPDTDIFATCTVYGVRFESGNCGVGMVLNDLWDFGCGYQYDGAYTEANQTTIIIGTSQWSYSDVPAGEHTIGFGWKNINGSTTDRPFEIFNPNNSDDERNQQFISSILLYEVVA